MTEKAIDEILKARIYKSLDDYPYYTDKQRKIDFLNKYPEYTEEEFWDAFNKIIDLLSWDGISDF